MVPCQAGYYCSEGTKSPTPADHFCPPGTYSPRTDLIEASQCYDCPAGKWCAPKCEDGVCVGLSEPGPDCDAGYYCPARSSTARGGGGSLTERPCPPGTYSSTTGLKARTECQVCPLGQYCEGAETPRQDCPPGTYGDVAELAAADDSTIAEEDREKGRRGCKTCPAGYKCDTSMLITPVKCGKGYYSAAGAQTCELCPERHYCDLEATAATDLRVEDQGTVTEYRLCGDGFICPAGTKERPYHISSAHSCKPGRYCPDSVDDYSEMILHGGWACPDGTYQPLYGAGSDSDCLKVPAGYYTTEPEGNTGYYDNKCPSGFWCP